jgi:hypothetical protein
MVKRFLEALTHARGRAGILAVEPTREILQLLRGGRDVVLAVGLDPWTLTLRQVVEDVAEFVNLTSLDECGLAKHHPHGLVQRLRAVEDHEQTAVRAQPATLQIREQALAEGAVLGRAVPQAQRVLGPVLGDAQRHDQVVLADVDAVEPQDRPGQVVQRPSLPGGSCP